MSNFWIGFIIGGFICGFIGFVGAAILAASGRASRMEERMIGHKFIEIGIDRYGHESIEYEIRHFKCFRCGKKKQEREDY